MKFKGLTPQQVEESRKVNGSNALSQIETESIWMKILGGFQDPMIVILLVALVIQLVLYFCGKAEWFEPLGIFIAIIIANGVAAIFENKQENKAADLKRAENEREHAKVIRDSALLEIPVNDVVQGDIVFLQAGDKIPADGIILEGTLKVDQAALNGESEEAKTAGAEGTAFNEKDLLDEHSIYRGTVIASGEAYQEVKVIGDKTIFGQAALEAQEDTRETPLQVKLGKLANHISTFGYIGAGAIVAIILAVTLISGKTPDNWSGWVRLFIDAITVAVTIIVCAVPEGLPMLSSILQAIQSLKMIKDNVLVRKINGLETAGSLSILFSDKTGTITEGRLSVVELATADAGVLPAFGEIAASFKQHILYGIGANNSAVCGEDCILGGNGTDRALLTFLKDNGAAKDVCKDDVVKVNAFDSNRKTSSIVIKKDGKSTVYIKGAPERILDRCDHYLKADGTVEAWPDKSALTAYLDAQASRSMRLLAVAKVDGESEDASSLTLVCILSIRDNVRKEVRTAVQEIQNAGIQVVMVTGDRKETAQAIAKDAGLITSDSDVVLTSFEMDKMSDDELKKVLPNLRVVARALPMDKSRLVRLAQELNLVVGMTGDGVNDAPALRKADVGFAMGSGTEVAKEAGEITILDDNLSSIEKAILYGRTMFKSIRKFLIFQLTVNVAAVLTCAIGPMGGQNVVMTVIQLLLINLAMDTMAAIAFGSEPPLKEYMKDQPIPREQSIVTGAMLGEILLGAAYITVICLAILFSTSVQSFLAPAGVTFDAVAVRSALFATFMMAITFNGFNARTSHINPFEGIGRNATFLVVMAFLLVVQYVFVTFGGKALAVEALPLCTWGKCLLLAVLIIPLDMIRKLFTLKSE